MRQAQACRALALVVFLLDFLVVATGVAALHETDCIHTSGSSAIAPRMCKGAGQASQNLACARRAWRVHAVHSLGGLPSGHNPVRCDHLLRLYCSKSQWAAPHVLQYQAAGCPMGMRAASSALITHL